jgi:hypothetical protein
VLRGKQKSGGVRHRRNAGRRKKENPTEAGLGNGSTIAVADAVMSPGGQKRTVGYLWSGWGDGYRDGCRQFLGFSQNAPKSPPRLKMRLRRVFPKRIENKGIGGYAIARIFSVS